MTPHTKAIAPLIKALAIVVREYVALATADFGARLKAIEDRPIPRDGKDGERGEKGDPGFSVTGPQGERGPEGPPGTPGAAGPQGERGEQGLRGADGLVGPAGAQGLEGPAGRDGRDGLPGVPGIQGEKGIDGAPGLHGRDGTNGRDGTLDNLKMVRRSERVVEFCFKDGTPIEGGLIKLNHPVWKSTLVKEADYEEGDLVQWGRSTWIALVDKPQGVPGQGPKEITGWQQFSKPGNDGKDLRPESPSPALPIVRVGKPKS